MEPIILTPKKLNLAVCPEQAAVFKSFSVDAAVAAFDEAVLLESMMRLDRMLVAAVTTLADEAQDDHHSQIVTVTVLDTLTGASAQDARFSTYFWTEGNGSCDCNRELLFDEDDEGDADDSDEADYCLGCHRYRIVAVEPLLEGYTLADFNRGYPAEE